jgi:hypothetical protein
MSYDDLRTITAGLLSDDLEIDLDRIADAVAAHARQARSPGRSVAAYCRHLRARGVGAERAAEIQAAVGAVLARDAATGPAHADARGAAGEWLTAEGAAHRLGMLPRTFLQRLALPRFRRLYGWPWWDGSRWYVPGPALDPAVAAAFRAGLPEREPFSNLPAWCETDDGGDAAAPPE